MEDGDVERYATSLRWNGNGAARVQSEGLPPVHVEYPEAFGGKPGAWSPETLLVASVETCAMLTFLAIARAKKVKVLSYTSSAEGTLSTRSAESCFIGFLVRPTVEVETEADVDGAELIFATLARRCFIGASLKVEPMIDAHVVCRPAAKPAAT